MKTVVRPIGPNDAGIPEGQLCEIVIPLRLPEGTILHDPKTGDRFDSDGKKLEKTNSEERDVSHDSHLPRLKASAS